MDEQFKDELYELRAALTALSIRLKRLEGRTSQAVITSPPLQKEVAAPTPPVAPPPIVDSPADAPPPNQPPQQTTEAIPAAKGMSLEQRVGASWLNKVGILVLLIGAAFFFHFAVEQGWINEYIRVAIVAGAGAILLGAGEWAWQKTMTIFAGGVTGGGLALLYVSVYVASPNFYGLLPTGLSFVLMCAVTVVGIWLSVRRGTLTTAILAQIGAYLTPLLLSSGTDHQAALMIYLIVVSGGFLIVSAVKRWNSMAPIALLGTVLVFAGWFSSFYDAPAEAVSTAAFAWVLAAIFLAYSSIATALGRVRLQMGVSIAVGTGATMAFLIISQAESFSPAVTLVQLLTLDIVIVAICLWQRWNWLRLGVFAWTAAVMLLGFYFEIDASTWFWTGWIWGLFAVFAADVLVRAWWRTRRTNEKLDATILVKVTAAMFAATYFLLQSHYSTWMGAYTFSLAGASFVLALMVWKNTGRRLLGYALLGQALVLLTLAMPIQFDWSTVTLAWMAQAVVAMAFAGRLKSKGLLVKALILAPLAVGHFIVVDIPKDSALSMTMLSVGGVEISYLVALAAVLAGAMLAIACMRHFGRIIWDDNIDLTIASLFMCGAAGLWGWQAADRLPHLTATWWWLLPAIGIAAAGLWRRSPWLAASGGVMLAMAVFKFLWYDSLFRTMEGMAETSRLVAVNWQFALGLALAAGALVLALIAARRLGGFEYLRTWHTMAILTAAVVVVWAGSFEVLRYFARPQETLPVDPEQARQMALSIWWASYATAMLAMGFIFSYAPVRYLSLSIFAITLAKVFLADMSGIEAGYRIASFVGLGALLVGASFLYQRYFSRDSAATPQPPSDNQ